MDPNLLLAVPILLLFAKAGGLLAERFGISSLVSEIISGAIAIYFNLIKIDAYVDDILGLGIIFILFIAGMSVKFEDLEDQMYKASTLAIAGGLLSSAIAFVVSFVFFNDLLVSFIIAIAFVSTDDGTTMRLLSSTGRLKSRVGKIIVASSISDDILGILCLSFFTKLVELKNIAINDIMRLFFVSIGFYFFILTVGRRVNNSFFNFVTKTFRNEYILFSLPIAIMFLLSVFSDKLGLGISAGAFLAGMIFSKSNLVETVIEPKVKLLSHGFFIPLFFALIGTKIIMSNIDIMLVLSLTVVAILGKYIGSGQLSRIFGYRKDEANVIGLISIPRGDYTIIISQIALNLGVITIAIYSSLITVAALTIILSPVLLRIFTENKNEYG